MRFRKNDGRGTVIITRRQLLRELMGLPLSAWGRYPLDEAETRFEFHLTYTMYGHVMTRCEDEKNENPALFVDGKRVSGASLLYSRLVGNWNKTMVGRLMKELMNRPISEWHHPIGSDWYFIDFEGDRIKLNRKRVGKKREFKLTINDITIEGGWKPLCDHLVTKSFTPPFE